MRKTMSWCAVLLFAAACGGAADGGAGWTGTVVDSAGVQLVRNSSQPVWGDGDAWGFEEVLTIGEAAGDPDYQFGQIAGLDVTSDGRILVLDNQAQHVKVFSPDGTFERTVGKAGSGPGEFGPGAALLMVGTADTVIVPDAGNQRVNVILLDEGEQTSFPLHFEEGIPMRWQMSNSGVLVAHRRALNLPNQEAVDVDLIARQAYDGSIIDTLATPPRGETFSFGGGLPAFHLFAPEPTWTLLEDGSFVFAMNNEFRITVSDLDGNVQRIITMPHESILVSDEDKQIITELIMRLMEQQGVPPQALDMIEQSVTYEDYFPAFTQLFGGPQNSLWVQRVGIPSDMTPDERENWNPMLDQGSDDWDVFDAEGRYLGAVTIPDRFSPFSLKGDLLYGVWRDEFEVQYVKVLRITGLTGTA
ncbi:MAG: 6-bladed beta-propeller [Candidatus Palauibacterales bacterium]|jgi:6-bladed beta-propeller|nr:6-bladed beta-propeller [Candidatus Palauibacterales bacterium]